MPKLNFPLNKYIKAVESLAKQKGFAKVEHVMNKGSKVRFELFSYDSSIPTAMWVIHHAHNRKKEIWSRDDYRKAATRLCCTESELIEEIRKS